MPGKLRDGTLKNSKTYPLLINAPGSGNCRQEDHSKFLQNIPTFALDRSFPGAHKKNKNIPVFTRFFSAILWITLGITCG